MNPLLRARASRTLAAALLAAAPLAHAHVGLEWPAALAGSSYKATFRISHGCGASPTRQVVVEIPAGVQSARPMPHLGWTVNIERAPLPAPQQRHGRVVTEDVSRITWTAAGRQDALAADHFDEFSLLATLPAQEGPLYWPVRQVCVEGRHDWVQVPVPGQEPQSLKSPAPRLDLLPGAGAHHAH